MQAVIHSMSCISHYDTTASDFSFAKTASGSPSKFLFAIHPPFKEFMPAQALRRMSNVLKMGVGAGLLALKQAGLEMPDAIITGTAMGCFEDTNKFLRVLLDNDERLLTPTSFIQSTHNTVSGQLALLSKCHGYNQTYTHQNLSFEFALQDAMLLLAEGTATRVLTGGVDELNQPLCELFERAGHIKMAEHLTQPIWNSTSKGYVAGEGAAFFVLGNEAISSSIARISGVKTLQELTSVRELALQVDDFLNGLSLSKNDISLVLSGISGDVDGDKPLHEFTKASTWPVGYFKHLCGEYFTSSGFALWLAASMLQKQSVPGVVLTGQAGPQTLKHILIVNQQHNQHYSLICVSTC